METTAESDGITRVKSAKPKQNKGAPVQVDHRFAIGRRIKLLTATFRERLGLDVADPDPVLLAAVEKAARLTALAEDAAARATACRSEGLARRCRPDDAAG